MFKTLLKSLKHVPGEWVQSCYFGGIINCLKKNIKKKKKLTDISLKDELYSFFFFFFNVRSTTRSLLMKDLP